MEQKANKTEEVCVIIGSASGMGEACARRLSGHGILLLADVNASRLDTLANELTNKDTKVETAICDISDKQSIESLAGMAGGLGKLKNLIVTAGISPVQCDNWKYIMSVNLIGTTLTLKAFQPLANPGASVVCIASIAGYQSPVIPEMDEILDKPLAPDFMEKIEPFIERLGKRSGMLNALSYLISKRGVQRLIKRQAPLWHAKGTRINSISPGLVGSPMGLQEIESNPEVMKSMKDMTVGRRMGTTNEIAGPVSFICSSDASFISGVDLVVDGGFMAESAALKAK